SLKSSKSSPSSFLDVRSVARMLDAQLGGGRRLSASEKTVVDCLSEEEAVDSMFTVGVQVIDTASINCNATQEEMCQYLKDASGSLDIEALCEPNYAWEREQGTDYLNRQLSAATPSPTPFVKPPPTAVVNVDDPLAVYQHYLQTIGFDISVESQASVANSSGTPLQNVVVAIVDSGTDESHEDLHTSIYTDENGKTIGYDFFDNDPIPDDVFGH
ncbi:Suppressor of the cold-sensitive snRNP bioproteinsis mutant brr1-1, partial [Perkinsus olseni]